MPSQMSDDDNAAILDASFHAKPAVGFDGNEHRVVVERWSMDVAYAESVLEIRSEGETTTLAFKALTPEQRELAGRIRAAHAGNRWAAFTDDDLKEILAQMEDGKPAYERPFSDEIEAELERRREAAS